MWKNRNSALRVMLTAAVQLVPLAMFLLPAAPAHAQSAVPRTREEIKAKLTWLGQELNLSSGQRDDCRPIIKNMEKEITAAEDNHSLSADQRRAKTIVIVQNALGTIRARILNYKQRVKFDQIKAQALEKMMAENRAALQAREAAAAAQAASKTAPEQPAAEAKPANGTAPAQNPPPSKGKLMAQKLAWLSQELGLNEKQKRKARPLVRDMTNKCLAVQGTPGLTPERMKAKQIVIINHAMMSMRQTILTPPQKIKYDAIKEQAIEKMLVERNAAKQG